ncbi:LysR family transcriptional regulator [Microbacterium sp. PI-1]|uniref:helix-turn-helix domain-containing protein n=1 Tax=Microbacterium sp. PI-1 TaxID=2545631 RepID=UPI00103CC627|nr:LysR family transcriptional regulator [Microbacterium sp. PI-1]TCJ21975.1 LysR family transcriptional regulator [Microbacterium sp. PI-1]
MVSLRILRTLVAVVDSGSFVAGARSCGYSTAQVSRQMNQLQRRLGAQLFEKNGRILRATPLGVRVAEQARELVAEADRFDRFVRSDIN